MIKRHRQAEPPQTNGRGATNSVRHEQEKTKQKNGGKPMSKTGDWFHRFSHKTSEIVGSPWTFVTALLVIIGWAILGPVSGFSDTWQLVINTATTIVTFLMVFLIQNTQNRDAKAMHLKLDELIHAIKGARNKLIDLEDLSDEEMAEMQEQFKRLGKANHRPPHRESSRDPSREKKS
jgi:low affinity Fe/Cu permease